MNSKTNKKINIRKTVFIFLFLLLFISVGYAILTTTLKINGTSVVKSASWDVHFENLKVKDGSVVATKKAKIEDNKTEVSYTVTLSEPQDYYEFKVYAVNAGSIDAMISNITNTGLTDR